MTVQIHEFNANLKESQDFIPLANLVPLENRRKIKQPLGTQNDGTEVLNEVLNEELKEAGTLQF